MKCSVQHRHYFQVSSWLLSFCLQYGSLCFFFRFVLRVLVFHIIQKIAHCGFIFIVVTVRYLYAYFLFVSALCLTAKAKMFFLHFLANILCFSLIETSEHFLTWMCSSNIKSVTTCWFLKSSRWRQIWDFYRSVMRWRSFRNDWHYLWNFRHNGSAQ